MYYIYCYGFYRFPKDSVLRQKWIDALRRENFNPSKYVVVCSAHFRTENFGRSSLCMVRLLENVIPSIFQAFRTIIVYLPLAQQLLFRRILLSLHRILLSLHRILLSLHRILLSLQRILLSLHRTLLSLHRTLLSLHLLRLMKVFQPSIALRLQEKRH